MQLYRFSLRNQLIEANSKITHLYSEQERQVKDRKNPYHHEKQLEELRNLQVDDTKWILFPLTKRLFTYFMEI